MAVEVPQAEDISRALSELDLNVPRATPTPTTINTPPEKAKDGLHYSKDDLLNLRSNANNLTEQVTKADLESIGVPTASGVKTPSIAECPAPPPPTPATPQDKDGQASIDTVGELNGTTTAEDGAPKKKKKKKSSGINKKPKVNPTGFEEFYADPPTTPEEHETESELYDPQREFHERIQTCIQRYRARRKLDSTRANILNKYLILGGVEATVKAFTGGALDKATLESATAEEIAAVQATDFIRAGNKNAKYYDPAEADKWVVDFEGVAKGFFSRTVPNRLGADTDEEIKHASAIIRNFLNYVLLHNVCPEYVDDVMAARRVCDLAERDLISIKNFRSKLPGAFNIAASTVCGGRYQGAFISTMLWEDQSVNAPASVGYEHKEAEIIFRAAIAFKGDDALWKKAMEVRTFQHPESLKQFVERAQNNKASRGQGRQTGIHITGTEVRAYEIVDIERASLKLFEEVATVKNAKGVAGTIKPLGTLKVKAWEGPGVDPEDMSDDEEPKKALDESIESFWLEDDILQMMRPGLKLELVVHELNIGIKFFDAVVGLYCSFHTYLENEKLHGWKEPVLNERPPPTEEDPDVEERAANAIMEGELEEDDKQFGGK